MTFLITTFVIVLATVLGAYWAFIVRPEQQHKGSAMRRLTKYKRQVAAESGVVRAPERLSQIRSLQGLLERRAWLTERVQTLLAQSGVNMTVGTFVLACFASTCAGAALGWQLFHMVAAALILGVLAGVLPYLYLRFNRARRLRMFEEQFPEAMDLISRALRAGHAFTTGLGMVADEIQAPVGTEFRRLYDEQNFGMSLPDALRGLAERVPVLDARFFVTAVLTQRESGGNLSEILDNLAHVMRERFKFKRQLRVISAHGRISAWILSGLPPVMAVVVFLTSPHYLDPLFTDPMGIHLVLIAGTLQVVGTFIIARMVRIEY
jgi:tight adherence protein B